MTALEVTVTVRCVRLWWSTFNFWQQADRQIICCFVYEKKRSVWVSVKLFPTDSSGPPVHLRDDRGIKKNKQNRKKDWQQLAWETAARDQWASQTSGYQENRLLTDQISVWEREREREKWGWIIRKKQAVSPKGKSSERRACSYSHHPSVSISLRAQRRSVCSVCVCVCVCACGGGVLAGVEQSCNEQILERESERERDRKRK